MNLNKIKNFFNKYFVFIFLFIVILVMVLIYILLPLDMVFNVYLTIFAISLVLRFIIELLSISNQIKIPIKDKKETLKKVYELFDLENTNTLIAINTRNEKVLNRAKKLFPGSRESKQKDVYSIMLPQATLDKVLLFLRDNNPERIIIHQFNNPSPNKVKTMTHSVSICIDEKLIIKYNQKQYKKEEIKKIKEELKN